MLDCAVLGQALFVLGLALALSGPLLVLVVLSPDGTETVALVLSGGITNTTPLLLSGLGKELYTSDTLAGK